MPTNLPPHYKKVEERYRAAREPSEKIAHLREMLAIMPHHKGTDKIRAELRRKLSALQEQVEQARRSRKGGGHNPYFVPRGEAPQVVLVGGANSGKSSLLDALTNARPEVADYPFTTSLPQPGMMAYEDVQIELVDTPPVMQAPLEPWLVDQARAADAVVLVADLAAADCCEAIEVIEAGFEERGLRLVAERDDSDPLRVQNERPALLAANKSDHPDAPVNLEFLLEIFGGRWPRVVLAAGADKGLDLFRRAVFDMLRLVRVYTKVPGKPPEMDSPYLLPAGATVLDVAGKVHREFLETFISARIWGSGKFAGQLVERDHRVEDGDVLEIQTR